MKLRNAMGILTVAALALAPLTVLVAAEKDTTVKGEVLDLACYVAHDGSGKEHAGCAVKCVKAGQPMGLKAADGTVYILFADHADGAPFEKAKDLAGKEAEITGSVSDRDSVKGITVHGVKAL